MGSNAGLVAVELTIALSTGSLFVLADASHSGVDLTLAVPGVSEVHSLRGRVSGPRILVDLVILVPGEWTLEQAHETAHRVEEALKRQAPEVVEVVIHVEPRQHDARLDASHAS
jgi:divalent metal cation (Fe/Co/Zn/Cd) transporter